MLDIAIFCDPMFVLLVSVYMPGCCLNQLDQMLHWAME